MQRILLVDDDQVVAETVRHNLEREGYTTLTAADGLSGLELARGSALDLIILDVLLPGLDGFSLCRLVRNESSVPMLIVSARSSEYDRISGLELGADDYLPKPFCMGELLARVRALLRRGARWAQAAARQVLAVGELTIDAGGRRAFYGALELTLTQKEFDLLLCLMRNHGLVLSRDLLRERVWGADACSDGRSIDVHIRWLREKIEADPTNPRYIQTVRGIGYRLMDGSVA